MYLLLSATPCWYDKGRADLETSVSQLGPGPAGFHHLGTGEKSRLRGPAPEHRIRNFGGGAQPTCNNLQVILL